MTSHVLRTRWVALTGIVLIALAVRVPLLTIGTWADEGITYADVHASSAYQMFVRIWFSEGNPPLFFLVERLWTGVAGYGPIALKSPALLFNLATIPLVALLARRLGRPSSGLLPAFIFAFLPASIWFSQEARPYSMGAFLTALCMLFYVRAIENPLRFPWWFVVSACALEYTHYVGLLILIVLAVCTAISVRGTALRYFVVSFAIIALSFVPWLGYFVHHVHAGQPWNYVPWKLRPLLLPGYAYATIPFFQIDSGRDFFGAVTYLARPSQTFIALAATAFLFAVTTMACTRGARSDAPRDRAFAIVAIVVALGLVAAAALGAAGLRYVFLFCPLTSIMVAEGVYRAADWLEERISVLALWSIGGSLLAVTAIFVFSTILVSCRLPKSGFEALVREAPHDRSSVWLIVPTNISAVYYTRSLDPQPELIGFPQWNRAFIQPIDGLAQRWANAQQLMKPLVQSISSMRRHGVRRLVIARGGDYRVPYPDIGIIPFHRTNALVRMLVSKYRVTECRIYPASIETMSMLVLDVNEPVSPGPATGARCSVANPDKS